MNNEFKIKINGNEYSITVGDIDGDIAKVEVNGMPYSVEVEGELNKPAARPKKPTISSTAAVNSTVSKPSVPVASGVSSPAASSAGSGAVKSPLPGVILEVSVKVGDEIKAGQKVVVLEAMKMENNINSDRDGKVIEIKVGKGDSVLEGADLIVIG
ncbi:MAG: biotin/lipoyl-binding protein [Prevotellaceae bacterium]|jgi:biotin carboxyl carrier protein|nr:biotin/lipoyl-binding protein [Prevotellaceae bacterium]